MDNLLEWCKYQNLRIIKNDEVFFVNERLLLKPDYIINGKIFVETPNDFEVTEKYLEMRGLFSKSYGTIMVIPHSVINDMSEITKFDIQNKFNIKF